ncbi:hypothetical protein [Pseudonocardia spinosispora]|nr:hypothetical protein [Pseudonocardia spinosispora]
MASIWTRSGQGDQRRAAIAASCLSRGYPNIFVLPEHVLLSSTGSPP